MLDALFSNKRQQRYASWVIRHRLLIVVVGLILTAASYQYAKRLKLNSNLIALLPEHTPSIQALRGILEKTGGYGDLMIMVEAPDRATAVRYAKHLLPKVRQLDWVGQAEIGRDTSFFEDHKLLYMNVEDLRTIRTRLDERIKHEKLANSPLFVDIDEADDPPPLDFSDIENKYKGKGKRRRYYESKDGRILLMVVEPLGLTSNLSFARRAYNELVTLVKEDKPAQFDPGLNVSVGGTFKNRLDVYASIMRDVKSSALWVVLGLFVLITAFFRHPLALFVIGIPLTMSICWTFAVAYWAVGSLNLITIFLTIILMGLGIDFGIHMFARFQRERRGESDINQMLVATVGKAGRASLTAALTTAASFIVLVLTDFRGFSDFGVIAGTGLIMAAVAFLVLLPALLSYLHDWHLMVPRKAPKLASAGTPLRYPRAIVTGAALVTVGALFLSPRVAFESDFRKLRAKIKSSAEFNRKMRLVFSKARDPAVVLVPDVHKERAVIAELKRRRSEGGDTSPIEDVQGVSSLLPKDVDEKLAIIAHLKQEIDKVDSWIKDDNRESVDDFRSHLDVKRIDSAEDLPESFTRPFFGRSKDGGRLVFIFQRYSLMDLRNALTFSETVQDIRVGGEIYQPASEPLVYADMLRVIKRDTPIALALSSLALIVLIFIDLRSLRATLLVLVPLSVGIIWMVGCMAAIPIKLNIMNSAVLPSVLGLGIDGGVHIYHRWREVGWQRMTTVVSETGGAVAACTATSIIGFGGMLSADHPGLRSIGTLAIFGLGACLLGAVIVMPSILALLGPRQDKAKEGNRVAARDELGKG